MKPITNYSMTRPDHDRLLGVFDSYQHAHRLTGGDLALVCFYMHNQTLVAEGREAKPGPGEYGIALRALRAKEFEDEARTAAVKVWDAQPKERRRSVAEVTRQLGLSFSYAKKLLTQAGRLPSLRIDQ